MKDEEFYSTIKIVTGEEIVAKVIYLEDEDKVMLEDPLLVEVQRSRTVSYTHLTLPTIRSV